MGRCLDLINLSEVRHERAEFAGRVADVSPPTGSNKPMKSPSYSKNMGCK